MDIKLQFERMRSQLSAAGLSQAAEWITQHTKVKGQPFSFTDHEYQLRVAQEQARVINTRKCSQIGLSELSVRLALAYGNLVPGFTTIYTLPTVAFARNFSTTRIDTVISGSETLKSATALSVNNAEIKQFGDSFLFVKGTMGTQQAISIPADCIISDEYDFSTIETVTNYQSRLTHSPYKLKRNFSTPTTAGYGISAEFEESQQWWLHARCSCCGYWFLPDYYEHVRIPGFTLDSLEQITKRNMHTFKVDEAYVECPHCGGKPDLSFPNREWVCANPDEHREAVGVQIQPFDAPKIILMADLIRASTSYARKADFVNFSLGLPASDAESALTADELRELFLPAPSWGFKAHFLGGDLGHENTIFIGGVTPHNELRLVHYEVIPIRQLEKRRLELVKQYKVVGEVWDQYPYQDTIFRMQRAQYGRNLFGAQFVERATMQPFELHIQEQDDEKAQQEIREVRINRNRAFDSLLDLIRTPDGVYFADCDAKEEIIEQLTDMSRIRDIAQGRIGLEREQFVWVKSKRKYDHAHHALLYLWIATQLRGALLSTGGGGSAVLGKLKAKGKI